MYNRSNVTGISKIMSLYILFLYSACGLFIHYEFHWSIGLIYSRGTVYIIRQLYSIVNRVLSWSAREAHLHPMRFLKRAPIAMCETAQDAHIVTGQSCINNLIIFFMVRFLKSLTPYHSDVFPRLGFWRKQILTSLFFSTVVAAWIFLTRRTSIVRRKNLIKTWLSICP